MEIEREIKQLLLMKLSMHISLTKKLKLVEIYSKRNHFRGEDGI